MSALGITKTRQVEFRKSEDFPLPKSHLASQNHNPNNLKGAVTEAITKLTAPIRELYEQSAEWKEVTAVAYPDPSAKKDVKKKVCELDLFLIF